MSNPTDAAPIIATDADFQQVVLEGSRTTPMLVDFWAPWCGPCKVIGPLLEKLAAEWGGKFQLVKVNMDENPMIAQAFMIRSIPTVKLLMNGEIRDEFVGAYPEPEIRKFLEKNLPSAPQEGASNGLRLWQEGRRPEAVAVFESVLAADPKNPVALVGMGHHRIEQGDLAGAREVVDQVSEFALDKQIDRAAAEAALSALRARVFLAENAGNGAGEKPAGADDLETRFAAACRAAVEEAYEEALEGFLAIVKKDRKFRKDGGRVGMLAVFDLLPKDSPLLATYRNQLSSLLFS